MTSFMKFRDEFLNIETWILMSSLENLPVRISFQGLLLWTVESHSNQVGLRVHCRVTLCISVKTTPALEIKSSYPLQGSGSNTHHLLQEVHILMKTPKMPSRSIHCYLAVRKFAPSQGFNYLIESSVFKVHRNVRVFAKEKQSTPSAI